MGQGDLVQLSELFSGGIKGFAKTTRRSRSAGPGPGTSSRRGPDTVAGGCHLLGVPDVSFAVAGGHRGGHPGVPGCPNLAAICRQAAQQRFSGGCPDSWQAPRPH